MQEKDIFHEKELTPIGLISTSWPRKDILEDTRGLHARKIVCLRLEILSFTQESDESLIAVWERFDTLFCSGPSLSIPDPVLLQHLYMGLNRETTTFPNLASNGFFLHTLATKVRELLLNRSQITPTYEAKTPQELVEKQIAEPESFPNPYQPSAIILDTGETQFQRMCLNLRMNIFLNLEIPQIITL
jgi:hypothetical protein